MITYKIKIDRFDELKNESVEKGIELALKQVDPLIQNTARSVHRYKSRTGNLIRATKTRTLKDRLDVYVDEAMAKYGSYIHDGRGRWAPDRFVENAIESNLTEIDTLLANNIDKELMRDR